MRPPPLIVAALSDRHSYTFFDGSPSRAILALLDGQSRRLSPAERDEIAATIERARTEEES